MPCLKIIRKERNMFNHKEGCSFKDFQRSLVSLDTNGPEVSMTIDESGIDCRNRVKIYIPFNFCPYCGVEKETQPTQPLEKK